MDSPLGPGLIIELLDRHAAALELYASQWSNSPADCVQEAYIHLTRRIQELGRLPEHPAAWLYRVVRNQAHNEARAQRRREYHEQIAARLIERRLTDPSTTAESLPLLEALDSIASTEREIIVLRIWSELTWQEIADLTNTSSSSAQRRYVAALTKLRQHLEPSCLPNPI